MFRKRFGLLGLFVLFVVFTIAFITVDLPALAAPQRQEGGLPDGERPGMGSALGKEKIPYLPGSALPGVEGQAILSPLESWSRVAFERYLEENWELYTGKGDFSEQTRLTDNDSYDVEPRINRGATRIVFSSDQVAGVYEIFSMNMDGSNVTRLTNNSADDIKPVWSPNGSKIAFQSYRDGISEVYMMNADGSGQTRLTHSDSYSGEPTWSPDGSKIAFTTYRNQQWRIWVMNADGTNPVQLSSQAYSENPAWSPDGTKIGFDADVDLDGFQELWWMNSDGTEQALRFDRSDNYTLWASGWSPTNGYQTFTALHLVYYYGDWYWDYASLAGISWTGGIDYFSWGADWNLDWATADVQPPTASMSPLASLQPYQFVVSWTGVDAGAGVKNYDVQVRDGLSGAWTDWKMKTTETSATFTGVGGHTYYFRVRGRDMAFNVSPWPTSYHAYTQVESTPPITRMQDLEPFTRGEQVTVSWGGNDRGGSGIAYYDIQVMDEDTAQWQNWLTHVDMTSAVFSGTLGHIYHFRSRGIDNALNVEADHKYEGDTQTALFAWRTLGRVFDNTDIPVSAVNVETTPLAFLSFPSDVDGRYSAYLASNPATKAVTWSNVGYNYLPTTEYGLPDAYVNVFMPPQDNVVADWGFESGSLPGAWQTGGAIAPTLDDVYRHNGAYSAQFGIPVELGTPEQISQPGSAAVLYADAMGGMHRALFGYDNGYFIYYSYQLPDRTWSALEPVDQPQNFIDGIRIAVDRDNIVHMVYTVSYMGVYYTWRDTNGSWAAPQLIYSGGSWLQDIAFDDDTNAHLIIGENYALVYIRQEGENWVIETVPGVSQWNQPAIAVDSLHRLHLAWTSSFNGDERVSYTLRQADGSWTEPMRIAVSANPFPIDLVLDSQEMPHVAWGGGDPQRKLFYSYLTPQGRWSDAIDFSGDADVYQLHMMIDEQDVLHFVWDESSANYTSKIYYAQVSHGEVNSGAEALSSPNTNAYGVYTTLLGGDVYATWSEETGGGFPEVFFARRHGGIWSEPVELSFTAIYSIGSQIVVDPMGGVHIAWSETDNNSIRDLYYLESLPLEESGDSILSQSFLVPAGMKNPTLSFLANRTGVSPISGNQFSLEVTEGITTTALFTSTTPSGWEHSWFDMSPWSGEQITLTFSLSEDAGFPPAQVLLDEVTLGAAHPDVWVDLSGVPGYAKPGDQLNLRLDYGNRGSVLAESSSITFTLPAGVSYVDATVPPTSIIGDRLVWQLADLPGKSEGSIALTLQVEAGAPLGQEATLGAFITTGSEEIEMLNNRVEEVIYLGYVGILPIIRR